MSSSLTEPATKRAMTSAAARPTVQRRGRTISAHLGLPPDIARRIKQMAHEMLALEEYTEMVMAGYSWVRTTIAWRIEWYGRRRRLEHIDESVILLSSFVKQ